MREKHEKTFSKLFFLAVTHLATFVRVQFKIK